MEKSKSSFLNDLSSSTSILLILLIIGSFLLGVTTTKLLSSQGKENPTASSGNKQPTAVKQPLHVAQALKLNLEQFKTCLEEDKYAKQVADDLSSGQKAGVNGTPTVFINGQMVVGAQPYNAFQTIIDQELNNTTDASVKRSAVDLGGLPFLGDKNAKVTIIEFADFQCPFCERWFNDVEQNLIKDYVNTGKVKFAFRNYAFLGNESKWAAEAALCANEQGKFWQYHDYLYKHQGPENSGTFSKENLE